MCEWCTTRWRQTTMKKTTASRICDFQWDLNILHNNIVAVCPSEEINTTSSAQTHHYWVPLIHSLYLYENAFFFFTTTWRKKEKMGFCTVPDHFILFVDWLSEWQSKQDASTCVHPRGRGQWVPLTFQSMSITGYRGGREASLVIVRNLRTSHVRWVAIISLIGSKKQRLMGELW